MTQQFRLYEEGSTFLYRLDPRVKLLAVLAVFFLSILFNDPRVLAPVFVLILALIVVGRVPMRRVALLLRSLSLLVAISLVLWPLIYQKGPVLFHVLSFDITEGGIFFGFG